MSENFVQVPWSIESSDLDPYQFRLWVHVARVGVCWQSVRTLAEACKMSVGKVSQTKNWLLEHGYLAETVDSRSGRVGLAVCSPDEQIQQNCSHDERNCSPDEQSVHEVNGSVHEMNAILRRTHEEENVKKNTEESEAGANGFWVIPENLNSADFIRAWNRWLSYVDERGLDFTETQAELTLRELSECGESVATQSVINSIRKGWRNIYVSGDMARASPVGVNGHLTPVYQANELGEY